jgi:DNA-directed RNA polymerase subunit RPC12/RpoP
MTANGQLSASAVRVNAHCRHCKKDIETDGSNRCPDCGAETLLESRGTRRLVSLAAIAQGPDTAESGGGSPSIAIAPKTPPGSAEQPKAQPGQQATVVLTASREARAWSTARQKLLSVLESQEAGAMERFEKARAEVQRIRRERAAIARDCELIAIDAGPSEIARARVKTVSTRRVEGVWPVKVGIGIVEHCRGCVTTERPPYRYGRCEPCYREKYQPEERTDDDTGN